MAAYTAEKLAGMVKGELRGDGNKTISGVADLKSAQAHQISFLSNRKYVAAARKTAAGVVIVGEKDPSDFSFTQIRVSNPSAAFGKIVELFLPEIEHPVPGIHSTAIIDKEAEIDPGATIHPCAVIGARTKIGAGSIVGASVYIGADVIIGKNSVIYPHVSIRERSRIGDHVIIHCGAVIGADGFGYEFQQGKHQKIPQIGYVHIDDDVEIGANTTIDRGRFDRTWIQEGVKIDNQVQIAHNVTIGKHSIIVAQAGISGSTLLGNYVTIAGQVGIVGHIEIGDRVTVTAQAGVSKDVPAGSVVAGHHALPLKESLKIEALTRRLPELWERLRELEEKFSLEERKL